MAASTVAAGRPMKVVVSTAPNIAPIAGVSLIPASWGMMCAMARLLDPADSVLIVIDVQHDFLARVQPELSDGLIERIAFLAAPPGTSASP